MSILSDKAFNVHLDLMCFTWTMSTFLRIIIHLRGASGLETLWTILYVSVWHKIFLIISNLLLNILEIKIVYGLLCFYVDYCKRASRVTIRLKRIRLAYGYVFAIFQNRKCLADIKRRSLLVIQQKKNRACKNESKCGAMRNWMELRQEKNKVFPWFWSFTLSFIIEREYTRKHRQVHSKLCTLSQTEWIRS